MPRNCPWCGRVLEIKVLELGDKIRNVCARCGFKIKEYDKPEPKEESKEAPKVVEVKQEEVPVAKQKPTWPFILGAIVLIMIIIILVKIFLV